MVLNVFSESYVFVHLWLSQIVELIKIHFNSCCNSVELEIQQRNTISSTFSFSSSIILFTPFLLGFFISLVRFSPFC